MLKLTDFSIYRDEMVLKSGINFHLKRGQIGHVVGQNGAGKSTLFAQIIGLLPSIGMAQNAPVLFLGHSAALHPSLTAAQNLSFLSALDGVCCDRSSVLRALAWAGLDDYADERVANLSAGQKRRTALARLYFSSKSPSAQKLWLLDEPLTALDVDMVARLNARLKAHTHDGGSVLLSSHQAVVFDVCLDLDGYV